MHKTGAAVPEGQEFTIAGLAPSRAQKRLALGVFIVLLTGLALPMGRIRERPARPTPRVRPGLRHRDGRNRFAHRGLTVCAVFEFFGPRRSS